MGEKHPFATQSAAVKKDSQDDSSLTAAKTDSFVFDAQDEEGDEAMSALGSNKSWDLRNLLGKLGESVWPVKGWSAYCW